MQSDDPNYNQDSDFSLEVDQSDGEVNLEYPPHLTDVITDIESPTEHDPESRETLQATPELYQVDAPLFLSEADQESNLREDTNFDDRAESDHEPLSFEAALSADNLGDGQNDVAEILTESWDENDLPIEQSSLNIDIASMQEIAADEQAPLGSFVEALQNFDHILNQDADAGLVLRVSDEILQNPSVFYSDSPTLQFSELRNQDALANNPRMIFIQNEFSFEDLYLKQAQVAENLINTQGYLSSPLTLLKASELIDENLSYLRQQAHELVRAESVLTSAESFMVNGASVEKSGVTPYSDIYCLDIGVSENGTNRVHFHVDKDLAPDLVASRILDQIKSARSDLHQVLQESLKQATYTKVFFQIHGGDHRKIRTS